MLNVNDKMKKTLRTTGLLALGLAALVAMGPSFAPEGRALAQGEDAMIYLPAVLADARLVSNAVVAPRPTELLPATEISPTEVPPTLAPTDPAPAPSPTSVAPEPTEPTGEEDCGARFIDVQPDPMNSQYPDPELGVTCSDIEMTVTSNGIPSFEFRRITPNDLQAQDYTWTIPLMPKPAGSTSEIPLLGPVAIMVDGLPIYGPNEAPAQGTADPYLDGILDFCNGHTAQRGDYHYHARANCLSEDLEDNVDLVMGYAFDGFPIMAPFVCEGEDCETVKKLESSWRMTSNERNAWDAHEYVEGTGDLDECNGMVGQDGEYRYYATDSFPYLLGCYVGTPTQNGPGGGGGGGGGGRPPRP